MKNKINKGISILGILIFGIIIILVLSYLKINIKNIVESPTGQSNIHYITDSTKIIWDKYFKDNASHLWNDIFVKFFGTSI